MNNWIVLVLSLSTDNATTRMRVWRLLKASGAAVLRDGVYVFPDQEKCRALFDSVVIDVQSSNGTAYVLKTANDESLHFSTLFDRQDDYIKLLNDVAQLQHLFTSEDAQEATKQLRKLRKGFTAIVDTDFFPAETQAQTHAVLQSLEAQLSRLLSPDEPHAAVGNIPLLDINLYRGRVWATRARPWVDRLASAWLIRRFIDPDAHILWLTSPADCPADALGFDFDGAAFTHVDGKVTFEMLIASFALEQPALQRFGAVVHFLDVGGIQPSEASGLEQILWGLRNSISDDDLLLANSSFLFDALLLAFTEKN